MITISKIDDARYCSSCGKDDEVYEINAQCDKYKSLDKTITLCKDCMIELSELIIDFLYPGDSTK